METHTWQTKGQQTGVWRWKKEKSEKIGTALLVSISKNKKVRCLECGIVSVIEKSRIELRNGKGDLVWDKVIIGKQYMKENVNW